jgi:acyl-coenzyme A thioesterase PaaI-like protein
MVVRRDGDTAVSDYIFGDQHVGAPGVAHGGAVAAVCDDLFGFLLYLVGAPAVTRSLTVEYLTAVRLGVPYRIVARVERREDRKLNVSLTGHDPEGSLSFTASALFLTVSIERLLQHADGGPDLSRSLLDPLSARPPTES